MIKFKYFLDPRKQETWINNVQNEGYKLNWIFMDFLFKFQETDEDYVTRIDYQEHMSKEDYQEYASMFEDFGWEKIRGGRFATTTQVFRKVSDGNDDIFSERNSIVNMYKRYIPMVSIVPILILIYNFSLIRSI